MSRFLPIAASAALAVAISAGAVQAQDFRALARQDLQTAHDELAANHPAPAIPGEASTSFRGWLDSGLQESLGMVNRVNSGDSHAYLLRYYTGGFRDSNISATPTFEGVGPYFGISWPGFTTGWRNGKYVVTYVKPGVRNAPQVGDVLVDCNTIPIEQFARSKLDRWEGNLDTEAGRVTTAPYLMWNRNNPFTAGVPSLCNFERRGRNRAIEIKPVPVAPGDLEAAYRATVWMPSATPLAIETVNGRPWVNVHSFADSAGWDAFNSQIEAQAAALRGPQGFVLDLRGAAGSSIYTSTARGYALANRIWTPEFTSSRQPAAGDITYRATQGNRDWYAATLGRMEADPRFVQEAGPVIEQTRAIVAAFDTALAAGQSTFTVPGRAVAADTGASNPVQGPVVVLVDAGCSGGCLDTLDLLSKLPNVRIAGSTTATDTIFIEPTIMRLPSNYSDLSYGHKAWTSRARANGQPYAPAQGLAYTGNPTDEAAVRTWVGTLFGG
ncbi:hypothetical protein [Brevundimonas lenta]|uniref:Tail specific protease domain-containing protein n=1 Tax=Brevundimonas lenta TaxID=424796 RepID=A0A7W6JCB3_9CAUL|nr:hypothetical protein [Brevundimonas lenta]MBB4082508.1 hypothetical protein [Brevundimonas lenta]